EWWDPTSLLASYQPYAIRNTIVTLIAYIPVLLFFRAVSLFPNAFARYKNSIVFTLQAFLIFCMPQYLFLASIAILVWQDVYIPMGVCSILKNFTVYIAQIAYSAVSVVAFLRYFSIVWQFRFDKIQAYLCTLVLAVPNIALAISNTFYGLPTPNDICKVYTVYHSESAVIMIQCYMGLQRLVAIAFHLRVAFYLRKLAPDMTGSSSTKNKKGRTRTHAVKLNGMVNVEYSEYLL
ncbi:hypothetical protein PFISCL1PPCAC_23238, partial [Pristionchus fissidentatus]